MRLMQFERSLGVLDNDLGLRTSSGPKSVMYLICYLYCFF